MKNLKLELHQDDTADVCPNKRCTEMKKRRQKRRDEPRSGMAEQQTVMREMPSPRVAMGL
jgi:hypothetical protein